MSGPGDALFLALAQAKARPSHTLRAVESAGQAGEDVLGGYVQGKGIQQELQKYKTLNMRLGDIFPPDSIPGGLTPDHTVGQLMQLAPILPYTRSPVADSIANQLSGAPSSVPVPNSGATDAPTPTIASTSMAPIPGSANPAPAPGTSELNSIEGAGSGGGANIPPGTPINVFGGGSSTAPSPSFKGMSYMDLQKYGPYLNDIRQGRQFQQGQVNENERARLSREQSAAQFKEGQSNAESRFTREHMGAAAEKISPSVETSTELSNLTSTLDTLVPKNNPYMFVGSTGGDIARQAGGKGTPGMINAMKIDDAAITGAAILDKQLAGRFNQQEAELLKKSMLPTGKDQGGYDASGKPNYGQDKLNKLHGFLKAVNSGNDQIIRNMASAMTGGQISSIVPTSSSSTQNIRSQGQPTSTSTGDPEADAAIQRIQSSNLNPQAKQVRLNVIRERMKRGQIR